MKKRQKRGNITKNTKRRIGKKLMKNRSNTTQRTIKIYSLRKNICRVEHRDIVNECKKKYRAKKRIISMNITSNTTQRIKTQSMKNRSNTERR
jgi:hypothetical protein